MMQIDNIGLKMNGLIVSDPSQNNGQHVPLKIT